MYSKSRSDLHTVVNGVSSKTEIADSFKNHFMKVSQPNNQQRVDCLRDSFAEQYQEAIDSLTNCSCSSYSFSLENIVDATYSMNKGKCCDHSSIHAEHLFNALLLLFQRVHLLFVPHQFHRLFVPHQFQKGTIVPIVKDRQGDKSDLNNFRGIIIAPMPYHQQSFQACLTNSIHSCQRHLKVI